MASERPIGCNKIASFFASFMCSNCSLCECHGSFGNLAMSWIWSQHWTALPLAEALGGAIGDGPDFGSLWTIWRLLTTPFEACGQDPWTNQPATVITVGVVFGEERLLRNPKKCKTFAHGIEVHQRNWPIFHFQWCLLQHVAVQLRDQCTVDDFLVLRMTDERKRLMHVAEISCLKLIWNKSFQQAREISANPKCRELYIIEYCKDTFSILSSSTKF